ncbi:MULTISPECIES: TatD family hydrolase [Rubrivivax]|uniref:TatD family hydrolase n=1 Tax=Rubrivivax benzoatilyticus TaxID=316997 RepID=A0ABX0HYN2_9BURK|nr:MULTISPECIES: TatD family hydrolase [Rubrivivax]MCD0416611.1 TatD family hydrolase [Rubrivivax sp. JA1024]EGJ10354.1 putative deoxyribonuclease [Rubrivivax benzoatilyticus JA2 = ATCC BAA-35]MCC9597431.1 TatD family hydrolase [Rubrivivax sp. JA1055]MCC9646311.1 TatD family hydrolase [Rubrivivax sp. JA1029]NHK98454.1 TatD family hydrolase [Rubrivivax benzoatilyticus]
MFVDSHCHLTFPELHGRVDAVLADMAAAGVHAALTICTTLEEFEAVHALALAHRELWCSVGVHPDTEGQAEPDLSTLVALARRDRVVAIGETGLDYYRLNGRSLADMAWQRERFRVHIRAARETGLPLVVHTRSSAEDTLAILKEEGAEAVGGVFHCFTETREVARAALDLGFHISFSGILTFRNAEELRAVALEVPLDRCLIETDSPYLAPVPHRGRTNEPAYVAHVAARLAELKGLDPAEVGAATTRNFERLFRVSTASAQA